MTAEDALVQIDELLCEGTGFCVRIAPHIFDLDGPPPVRITASKVKEQDRADIEEAVIACPTRAISLADAPD